MAIKNTVGKSAIAKFQNVELFALPTRQDNYTYILRSPDELWVIDPGESAAVLEWCESNNAKITHILCTHHHHDHVEGVPELKQKFSATVYSSSIDKNRVAGADKGLLDKEVLKIAGLDAKMLFIPGHTNGHMAVHFAQAGWVFTGDTLFGLGCGRLFEGTHEQLFDSLQLLGRLPDKTQIYCGHEYTARNLQFALTLDDVTPELEKRGQKIMNDLMTRGTSLPFTIIDELRTNPFLRCDDLEDFVILRKKRDSF